MKIIRLPEDEEVINEKRRGREDDGMKR